MVHTTVPVLLTVMFSLVDSNVDILHLCIHSQKYSHSLVGNITEAISLVPVGRVECTNFTDFEGITEAGRTAAGVVVAIVGSLAQFSGFVLIKYCYKNSSG